MIDSIRLRDFKSHVETGSMPLAPLTIFIGANNTGKSSLIHALLALKQTVRDNSYDSRLVTNGPEVGLGSFVDIVHSHSERPESFEVEVSRKSISRDEGDASGKLKIEFGFCSDRNKISVKEVEVSGAQGPVITYNEDETWKFKGEEASEEQKQGIWVHLHNFLPHAHVRNEKSIKDEPEVIFPLFDIAMSVSAAVSPWSDRR